MARPEGYTRDYFARIEELRKEGHLNTPGQHVVSKVVVRRFADSRGMVRCINLQHPHASSRLVGYRTAGKVTNFIPVASTSAEFLWKQVEDLLPSAIDLADADGILDNPEALKIIRNTVALHYVRNLRTRAKMRHAYAQARDRLKRKFVGHPMVEREFVRRYGLYPAGREARELVVEQALEAHDDIFRSGLILRQSMERVFADAKEWLANSEIEVIHPANGEFLISDAPALTISANNGNGRTMGVALGDAEQIVMPLTRRTSIAIGSRSMYGTLPTEWVELLNTWQILSAHQYVYLHPDSDLEALVRRVEHERHVPTKT